MSRLPNFDSVRRAISLATWCALAGWYALSLSGCCSGWGPPLANNPAKDSASRSIARNDRAPGKFDPYQLPTDDTGDSVTGDGVTIEQVASDSVEVGPIESGPAGRDEQIALAAYEEASSPERPAFEQEGDYGSHAMQAAANSPAQLASDTTVANAKSLGYNDKALRGQSPSGGGLYTPGTTSPGYGGNVRPPPNYAPGSGDSYQRQPMTASGGYGSQPQVGPQSSIYGGTGAPPSVYSPNAANGSSGYEPAQYPSQRSRVGYQGGQPVGAPAEPGDFPRMGPPPIGGGGYYETVPPNNVTPLDVFVEEGRTGRISFGVGVNSNAGVNGNITIDERNFDLFNPPRSWDDWINGTAFRGAGQGFRIEAMPGSQVSRYLVSLTEPYLFGTDISSSNSAYYFQRYYFDWAEQRVGGRTSLGYRLSPDLSASAALRYEDVKVYSPRIAGVPELDNVLGSNDLATGMVSLIHDTRDNAFFATQGNYISLSYEQAFGQFSFPRGEVDARQHIRLYERPDGSGAHVLSLYGNLGVSGTDTPLFENYFIGGYGSLRGWQFRGIGPLDQTVRLGGRFKALGTVEYTVPVTADDMVRLAFFVDAGTVQSDVKFADFRVAPGVGVMINVPALGPAPLALNFAFPVLSEPGDSKQVFSFQMGAAR